MKALKKKKKGAIANKADGDEDDNPSAVPASSAPTADGKERVGSFKGYDVSHLPRAARPVQGAVYKGQHSYTAYVGEAVAWTYRSWP